MKQRVSVIEGKNPVLLIAPSGANDRNTDLLTELIADKSDSYAVINWGWQRSQHIDFHQDKADCNNVFHLQGVVYDEFLEPILRYKNRITKGHRTLYQFVIQGVAGNDLPPSIDVVAGDGSEESRSCEEWVRNVFTYIASEEGLDVRLAKPGTILAGAAKKHLNQLFAQWKPDSRVQSIQVEVLQGLRESKIDVELFSDFFSKVLVRLAELNQEEAKKLLPRNFSPKSY